MKNLSILRATLLVTLTFSNTFYVYATQKGELKELKLNSENEDENVRRAATTEALITKSEENALKDVEKLLLKYKGTQQEPDLLFRKAELLVRRSKSGRFFDLYRGEKSLDQILKPELKQKGAKDYLHEAINIYISIETKFPKYPFMDEVLFNQAFADQQIAETKKSEVLYFRLLSEYPNSPLKWEAHMALGELLFLDQKYNEALTQFVELEKVPKSPLYSLSFYKRAWCHYNLQQTEIGLQHLEKVMSLSQNKEAPKHLRNEARRDLSLFYSEIRKSTDAIKYFSNLMTTEELALTLTELADLYNHHGKSDEAYIILSQFTVEYPKTPERLTLQMKLIELYHENKKENELLTSLVDLHDVCQKSKATFCTAKLKTYENNMLSEWWEKWNKCSTKNNSTGSCQNVTLYQIFCKKLFPLYFQFEDKEHVETDMHFAYAEIQFYSKDFKSSSQEYDLVAHQIKVDPEEKHKALYGAIVSYNEVKSATQPKEYKDENLLALHKLLTEYMTLYPQGQYFSQVEYQKAFLHFQNKEWNDAEKHFLVLEKSTQIDLKEKSEDLLFEIYNTKEEFDKLKNFSFLVYTNSNNERKEKIKNIYQQSQLKLIDILLKKGKEVLAAKAYIDFHNEHKPSAIASKALEAAIPLYFKNNLYEEGAQSSEKRSVELSQVKDFQSQSDYLNKAAQAWLFIGQIDNALNDTLLISEIHPDLKKQKEALLLSENLNQLLENQTLTFKIWDRLQKYLDANEQETYFLMQKKYFDAHSDLSEAKKFYQKIETNKIEPFYSENELHRIQLLFQKQKYTETFHACKNMLNGSAPLQIKAQARSLQAQILNIEFEKQSLKAQADRVPLVLALKTEKMDKAITAFTSALTMSPVIADKIIILTKMNQTYTHYITSVDGFIQSADTTLDNELKSQLLQVLTVMKSKSAETIQSITQLEKQAHDENKIIVASSSSQIPTIAWNNYQLNWPTQNLLHVYVPSWNESLPDQWKDLQNVSASAKNCTTDNIKAIESETMLGSKINQCLKLQKNKELLLLTNTFLKKYPLSPWGAFYRAITLNQTGSNSAALWYLELALKKDQKAKLVHYEKARQLMTHDMNEVLPIWQTVFNASNETEESQLIQGLFSYTNEGCTKVSQYFENLHRDEWNNYTPKILILSECFAKNQRISEAVSLLDKVLKMQTNVLVLIQRAKIAEEYELKISQAIQYYEKAKAVTDSEEMKKTLEQKLNQISVHSSTSNQGTFKEEGNEKEAIAGNLGRH